MADFQRIFGPRDEESVTPSAEPQQPTSGFMDIFGPRRSPLEQDELFNRLLELRSRLMSNAVQGALPTGGRSEAAILRDQIEEIEDELARRHGLSTAEIQRMVAEVRERQAIAGRPDTSLEDAMAPPVRATPLGERVGSGAMNVLRFAGGLAEPLTLPGDLTRAAIAFSEDWATGAVPRTLANVPVIRLARETDWISYAPSLVLGNRQYGRSPLGGSVTGSDLLDRFGLTDRLGLKDNPTARELVGVGLEIITDPTLLATWIGAAGKAVRAAGAASKVDDLVRSGQRMLDLSRTVEHALSPAGAVSGIRKAAQAVVSDRRVEAAQRTLNRWIDSILDIEVPMPFSKFKERVDPKFSYNPFGKEELPVRVRDLLFQRGRAPIGDNLFRPEWLAGGPSVGVSAIQRAEGRARPIARIAAEGINELNNILLNGLGVQRSMVEIPALKIRLLNYRRVPSNMQGFVNAFHENVWAFVDSVGAAKVAKGYRTYLPKIRQLARLYNVDPNLAAGMFRQSVDVARATAIKTGYVLSDYDTFVSAMESAARSLNIDYVTHRQALELFATGMDLGEFMRTGALPTDKGRIPARMFTQEFLEQNKLFRRRTSEIFAETGAPVIDPLVYLHGIRDGYLRRVFLTKDYDATILESIAQRVLNGNLDILPEVDFKELVPRLTSSYGKEISGIVTAYLRSRPSGIGHAIRVDDLADLVRMRTGRNVTPAELSAILNANNPNYERAQSTLDLLRESMRPREYRPFLERMELTEQQISALVNAADPALSLAKTATAGMKSVKARQFLKIARDNLEANGWLYTLQDLETLVDTTNAKLTEHIRRAFMGLDANNERSRFAAVTPFVAEDGLRYVVIPQSTSAWGALAGSIIPEEMAIQIMRNLRLDPGNRASNYERVLNMYRRALISPFSTSARNIVGNLLLQHMAGADMFGILRNLPRAHRIRAEYYQTGKLRGFEGYEDLVPWLNDDSSILARELQRPVEQQLARLAGATTPESLIDRMERITEVITETPALGGFLGMFKWGEETTRMASFLWTYDELIARGLPRAEAVTRAAHFAMNATYDYGSLPKLADLLRRTGLSVFPQFAMFTVGRLASTAYRRPGQLTKIEHARAAATSALVDEDDQWRLSVLMPDWLKWRSPLAFPVWGQDGKYNLINLEFWLPQGSGAGPLFMDPLLMGAFRPLIEAAAAIATGSGEAFYSKQFGERVFSGLNEVDRAMQEAVIMGDMERFERLRAVREQGISPANTAIEVFDFLMRNYFFPGQQRLVRKFAETVLYNTDREAMERLGQVTAKYHNLSWGQFFARALGFSSFTVDVTGERTLRQRLRELEAQYRDGKLTREEYLERLQEYAKAVRSQRR